MESRWKSERVVVTGGAGFLGSFVVERCGAAGERCSSRARASTTWSIARGPAPATATRRPRSVIHLAAQVGGIGANRDNPGRFFYDNADDGRCSCSRSAACTGVEKLVATGTICAYPKFAPVPFQEDDLWNGYPEETNAPYGTRQEDAAGAVAGVSRAVRASTASCCFPVNLYGPRDNFDLQTSHVIPAMIRKFVQRARARRPRGRAVGRRLADARVPLRRGRRRGHRAGGRALRLDRSGQPGQRRRDHRSATWPQQIARLMRLRGPLRLGHQQAQRAAAPPARRRRRAKRACSASRRRRLSTGASPQTVAWYEEHAEGDRTAMKTRAHHRHHRPGRLVPGRAAAREGLRGLRHRPPLAARFNTERIDHIYQDPARPDDRLRLRLRRPGRRQLAEPRPAHRQARRDLQPRRAEPRARQLRRARVHRRR